MASDFSNQAQAYANPPFFAHIRVCMRPLPNNLLNGTSLFLEQAYDFMLNQPYRLRVIKLSIIGDRLELENFKVKDQERFYGASRNLDLLNTLTEDLIEKMEGMRHGCNLDRQQLSRSNKTRKSLYCRTQGQNNLFRQQF